MKITLSRLSLGALLATAALAPAARAQSADSSPLLVSPALPTPALSDFAGVPSAPAPTSFSLAQSAPLAQGLQSAPIARTYYGRGPSWARFASGTGNILFLGAGTLLPLIEDGKNGGQHSLRTADSLIVSTLIGEALKRVTHKKRPDGSNYESFPSGHATAAFAVATMESHYHPKQAILWYGGATVIAASRVKLHRHYTVDVIAGAALGYFTSKLELKQGRGLLLRPFIHPEGPRGSVSGLSIGGSF